MNIKATIVPFQQGTEEWAQHRARSLNASDLAAAMGISPYLSRADLIKRIATGIVPEVDAATQRRFDKGHEVEAAARPLAEEIIGEELYASVFAAEVDGLHLSASLDGHTLLNEVTFEHKQANADLVASLQLGVIPEQYHPQMEQGLMLTGATRCLFMASNGDKETMRCAWYESNPELRAKIIPTWKQLMADVAAYVPTAAELPKPTGRAPEALPALRVEVTGMVTASNLAEFKAQAMAVFGGISRDLKTDEDFANAEATAKWAKGIEDKVASAKDAALAQTGSIDDLFRTMDEISAEARRVRLDLDKLVKARKEAIKGEIVAEGVAAFAAHIRSLNAAMPANYMPQVPADFGGSIKGLKSVDSIRNAVSTELANAKIRANEIATRIQTNIGQIDAANAPMLFADMATLVLKQPDDLAAVIAQRLAAEQQRKEAERERIRAEEAARLEREAAARAAAEKAEADRVEREAEAARKVREAAEEMARKREQDEADRIARELAEAARPLTAAEVVEADADRGISEQGADAFAFAAQAAGFLKPQERQPIGQIIGLDFAPKPDIGTPADDGARLSLGQINAMLAPVSITVAGLSLLGYEPVAVEKAARLYRASDIKAICAAISAHVLAAPVKALEAA